MKSWLNEDSLKIAGLVLQSDGSYKKPMLNRALDQSEKLPESLIKSKPTHNTTQQKECLKTSYLKSDYKLEISAYNLWIGIDAGTHTGFAIWDGNKLRLQTIPLHKALHLVLELNQSYRILVRVEDARLRKWFGTSGKEMLQGAGSIKRDCYIWDEFLTDNGIAHEFVSPKQKGQKVSKEYFVTLTGYLGRTSQHSRDAGMLVFKK